MFFGLKIILKVRTVIAYYRRFVDKFLKEGKRKYADAAMQIGNYEVGSDDYLFFKEQMDNVSNAFKSAKAQVDLFGGKKGIKYFFC